MEMRRFLNILIPRMCVMAVKGAYEFDVFRNYFRPILFYNYQRFSRTDLYTYL